MKRNIEKMFFCLILVCLTFRGCTDTTPENIYNNTVTTLSVGQAACTLVESDGAFRLIDRGRQGGDTDITAYLNSRNVKKIDLLVLSHFHYDHTSEALDIIRNFEIGTILIPTLSAENIPDTYFYKSLQEDSRNGYYSLMYAVKDMEIPVGNGKIKVLADTINTMGENNTSIVLSYTQDDFTWVYTGDIESDCDDIIINCLPENISLYTASHHGSRDSNSMEVMQKINPEYMVISCGKDNDYGHPHKKFIERAQALDIPYGITYEKGNIVYNMQTGQMSVD